MNGWKERLIETDDIKIPLIERVYELFRKQRTEWEEFRNNEKLLGTLTTKIFINNGMRIVVQANPGRSVSINAKVDPESIGKRPCFLCPSSLPSSEKGIAFGEYILLPNPYPILKYHMTIAYKEHIPQQIEGRIYDLCILARTLGPDMFVLYNGPRCGASAPDHMHFQACCSSGVPLFEQLPADYVVNKPVPLTIWGRHMFTGRFTNDKIAADFIQSVLDGLKNMLNEKNEPMINIVAYYNNEKLMITLFPRKKHRSSCFFAKGENRISISPAAMEMAGIVVVADKDHLERVNEKVILNMYDEITIDEVLFNRLAADII